MCANGSFPVEKLNLHKDDIKTLFLELNFHLRKWLILGSYKPSDQSKSVFLESLSKWSLS